jgi:hypothetical protein
MNLYRRLQTVSIAMLRELGRCPHCMRKSFVAAVVASAASLLAREWIREALALIPLAVLAAAMIMLWAAHLVIFSLRQVVGGKSLEVHLEPDSGRRSFLPTFAKALAGAAVLTALPKFARAEDKCDRCISNREKCMDACGDVSDNPDPQAHLEWGRCRRSCREQYDCTDACEHPSDDPPPAKQPPK